MATPFSLSWTFTTENADPTPGATLADPDLAGGSLAVETQAATLASDIAGASLTVETQAATLAESDSAGATLAAETQAASLDNGSSCAAGLDGGDPLSTFDIDLIRGDYRELSFTITETVDNVESAMDLTNAIVKFTIKRRREDDNADAVAFKKSYDSTEVEIVDANEGIAAVKLEKPDTRDLHVKADERTYFWDLEVTRRGDDRTGADAGTLTLALNSGSIVGTGTSFLKAHVGDVLIPSGTGSPNQVACTITSITDNTHLEVDYASFTAQSGVSFDVKIGKACTPCYGSINLTADTTR